MISSSPYGRRRRRRRNKIISGSVLPIYLSRFLLPFFAAKKNSSSKLNKISFVGFGQWDTRC
jgi:hypothetical protein